MTESTTIDPISREEGPTPVAQHRVLITFRNDHELDGMKVEIIDVTPEQCAVAAFHISRSANQLADMRQMAALQAARGVDGDGGRGTVDIEEVRRNLAKGH